MGKTYINVNGQVPKEAHMNENEDLCAANGTYCLKDCTYKENTKCKRHLIKQEELKNSR
jgi:hypothetical protein